MNKNTIERIKNELSNILKNDYKIIISNYSDDFITFNFSGLNSVYSSQVTYYKNTEVIESIYTKNAKILKTVKRLATIILNIQPTDADYLTLFNIFDDFERRSHVIFWVKYADDFLVPTHDTNAAAVAFLDKI